ncbi:MAG: sodium ion-translocating decarboxylase subunit beta [Bacteroidaceae bacterium]|nr:sodium ion-translocating decarboxylase subunit beta [Bacteroidaceae bacterium]
MKNIKFLALLAGLLLVAAPMMAADFNLEESMVKFVSDMGFVSFFVGEGWKNAVMIGIGCFLLYLAIKKEYEPLLLLPIAFGMILTNLPGAGMFHTAMWNDEFLNPDSPYYHSYRHVMAEGGLLDVLYIGVKAGVYPCLIFLGVGAMTDFGPLIANPKSLLLGAAAQIGIFATFLVTQMDIFGFNPQEAASIGIIGGADGPTAIFLTTKLAPHLLGPIAVAAYSYMALVPVIQPPIMRALTTKKERMIRMEQLRTVSKKEKILFPIIVAIVVSLILPSAATLIGCLMLGNLMKESGVVERLSKAAQNELNNIVVIFLGTTVGATATAEAFFNFRTISILCVGIVAFGVGTAGGVLLAKLMNLFLKKKINPLIGSAGVSAVPMAARVSQTVGQEADKHNFLLMHAMGPNVAGVIGSAVAAGILLRFLGS